MFFASNTPAVVVDLDQAERNITQLISALSAEGIAHRPHVKTHKSLYFSHAQLRLGAKGITCAKLGEAEAMVLGGIGDVTIAYPIIGNDKLRRLGNLLEFSSVTCVVNSMEGARGLSVLGRNVKRIRTLIEVDGGMRRGGLAPFEPTLAFARQVAGLPGLDIVGLMYYGGTASGCHSLEEVKQVVIRERDELCGTAELLSANGLNMSVLSGGSSYSGKMPKLIRGITEARCGTYIFNDCAQLSLGMVDIGECALTVHATVVCVVDERHVIIDAGSKSLGTDLCANRPGYGLVIESPDATITKLNEEHGFVETRSPHGYKVGDGLRIVPNHACTAMNLANAVIGTRGGKYDRTIAIEARGMSQ